MRDDAVLAGAAARRLRLCVEGEHRYKATVDGACAGYDFSKSTAFRTGWPILISHTGKQSHV